jgi:CheY-like chemotaxis protein
MKKAVRIALFDDSAEVHDRFRNRLDGQEIEILSFMGGRFDSHIEGALVSFKPSLIIMDLLMGGARSDGYTLIKDINRVRALKNIPIIVCSKLINSSSFGRIEKEKCLKLPGVVAAYGKVPDFPPIGDLLRFIKLD